MLENEPEVYKLDIYIGESDHWQNKPLYLALLELARRRGMAGGTVVRAIAGFGRNSHIRSSNLLELSTDLPILVTFIDTPEKIKAFLPDVKSLVRDGLVTCHSVQVFHHAPQHQP